MTEDSPDRPFLWSEIHHLAESKLAELEKTIRGEIGSPQNPVPPSGGARHRFFVLLDEKAVDWATRASIAYKDGLAQIGRENASGASYAIWCHGLRFFISEKIHDLLLVACGFGPKEHERLRFSSSGKYPTPPAVLEVRIIHRAVCRIVNRISKDFENKSLHPNVTRLVADISEQATRNPLLELALTPPKTEESTDDSAGRPNARNRARKKPGRHPTRNPDFQAIVGRLWLEEMNGASKVSVEGLKKIASKLDASDFKRPSDHLEAKAKKALKVHNRNYGNSPAKRIMTWTSLVESGDPGLLSAMRKLLSRCGCNIRK